MRSTIAVMTVVAGGLLATAAPAQEWGDLTATFVFDGAPPEAAPLSVTADKEFCNKFNVLDESLAVHQKNSGIANVIAYLYLNRGDPAVPVHPSYQETANGQVKLDNNCCRFDPHVVLLRTTQTLVIANSDDIGHNCKVDTLANSPINFTIPSKGKLEQPFPQAEKLPSRVSCSIHPWMSGWLVIKDNPYMAVSDADGKLALRNLPVGKWTIQFWHERAGYLSRVKQSGQPVEWKRGRLEVTIKPGANALGEIKLAPTAFAEKN